MTQRNPNETDNEERNTARALASTDKEKKDSAPKKDNKEEVVAQPQNAETESEAQARKIAASLKTAKKQRDILIQLNEENKNRGYKGADGKGDVYNLIVKREEEIKKLIESAESIEDVKSQVDAIIKKISKDQDVELQEELQKAQKLTDEGQEKNDSLKELSGLVLQEKFREEIDPELETGVERIVRSLQKEQPELISDEDSAASSVEGAGNQKKNTWRDLDEEINEKIEEYLDEDDSGKKEKIRQEVVGLEAQAEQMISKATRFGPLKEIKTEIDQLNDQLDKKRITPVQFEERLNEVIDKAKKQDQVWKEADNENAGMATEYVGRRAERLLKENVDTDNPARRKYDALLQKQVELTKAALDAFARGEIEGDQLSEVGGGLFKSRVEGEKDYARDLMASMSPAERKKYYDPLPADVKEHDNWVWRKIKELEDASISPATLVNSPAYLSLLYALTDEKLSTNLKANINAWRTTYEMVGVWDGSGAPTDVLNVASAMDPSAFIGLLGQYDRDENGHIVYIQKINRDGTPFIDKKGKEVWLPKYTEHAYKLQQAFALLDAHGYDFANPYANMKDRVAIHDQIGKELGGEFGVVYEKLAYKYWKMLGREGRFDRVMVKAETKGNNENADKHKEIKASKSYKIDKPILALIDMKIKAGTILYGREFKEDIEIKKGTLIVGEIRATKDMKVKAGTVLYGKEFNEDTEIKKGEVIVGNITEIKKGQTLFSKGAKAEWSGRKYSRSNSNVEIDEFYIPLGSMGKDLISQKLVNKRADGYTRSQIKFWYRRLLPGGLYAEKNITYLETFFDKLKYGVKDFLTGKFDNDADGKKGEDGCTENVTEEMLESMNWEDNTTGYSVWIDDLRKAADTRKELIKPDGILEKPIVDFRNLQKIKEAFETYADKKNTAFVDLVDAYIQANRKRGLIPERVKRPLTDEKGNTTGKYNTYFAYSEVQAETGASVADMNREDIEEFINKMVSELHLISADKGEQLKRKWLSFMGFEGRGSVRFMGRIAESGPSTIIGMLFAMFGEFFQVSVVSGLGGGGGAAKKRR